MSVARLYVVGSPFNGTELAEIDFEQSADTMYLAHIDHAPTKLVRAGHTDWTFSTLTFGPALAVPGSPSAVATQGNTVVTGDSYFAQTSYYAVTAIDDETGQETRASAAVNATTDLSLKKNYVTIAWSAVTGAERYRVYKARNTADFGYIGTTTSLSFIDDNIGPDYSDGPPQGYNPFPGAGDYPSTVTFHEQRLLFARTSNRPNAIFGSRSGDYENFDISRPLKASDSLSFALVAGRVNAVNQLVSTGTLLALTSDSVFKISGDQDGYITPSQIVTRRQNGRGSSRLSPLVVDNVTFYQVSTGNGVRSLGYKFEIDAVSSDDVTIFSPHLFIGFDIVSWAYAQEPRSIIWAARSDGKLLAFTWEQEQQVWGWTLCETDGLVESVCAISENGEDRLYLTARRVIGGVERVFLERMASATWETQEDCCFLDSAVSYAFDTPSAVLTNLHHLEGRTISALGDASVFSGLVVTNGSVTLPLAVSKATAGLPYDALIETLPLAYQGKGGWTIGKRQTAPTAIIRVVNTRGIEVGPSDNRLTVPKPRTNEALGAPNGLLTGLIEVQLPAEVNDGYRCVVKSVDPLPMTIAGIYLDPSVSG